MRWLVSFSLFVTVYFCLYLLLRGLSTHSRCPAIVTRMSKSTVLCLDHVARGRGTPLAIIVFSKGYFIFYIDLKYEI